MKRIIIYLIFLISFSNAIQCYNGKTYVDIPESKLSEVRYTEYNITHSSFDCKIAYKRYLKVKETEQVNVSNVTKSEKVEEEPSKIGFLLPICLLVIVGVIWLIKNVIKNEQQDEWNLPVQKEQVKQKETVSVQKETDKTWNDLSEYYESLEKIDQERQKKEQSYFDTIVEKEPIKQKETVSVQKETDKTWNDLSKEYSENLRKLEQERVKNGFYEIPKSEHVNNSLNKTKTAYELLLERPEWKTYRLKVLAEKGKKCEWCGSTNKILQVHHKFYLKYPDGKHILPWEYNINCLLVLCNDCHTKAHKKYKIKSYYVSY